MNSRKLVPKTLLADIAKLRQLGVPLRKLIRDHELDISGPHLTKLLDTFGDLRTPINIYDKKIEQVVCASMFPAWLDNNSLTAQDQPDNYKYVGRFPIGEWQHL